MSIWAEERRQGTDELLLTMPAGDFDVVLGKYLAAVAIYSASLVFSLVSNWIVLMTLGWPDAGLLFGTYFGYWIVGLAMLVDRHGGLVPDQQPHRGLHPGALFNAPLAFAGSMPDWAWLRPLKRLSISEQFRDFASGVISFASIGYFLAIVCLMLYLSMVLIGRRHWRGGAEGSSAAGHYLVRLLALVLVVGCSQRVSHAARSAASRRDDRTAQLAVAAEQATDQRSRSRASGRDRVLRQPHGAGGVRPDAAQSALHAPRVPGAGRRQDSRHRPRSRAVQRRGHDRRAAVRHHAHAGRSAETAAPTRGRRSSWGWP